MTDIDNDVAVARHHADRAVAQAREADEAADRAATIRDYSVAAGHAQGAADLCARSARAYSADAADAAEDADYAAHNHDVGPSDRRRRVRKDACLAYAAYAAARVMSSNAIGCSAAKYEGASDDDRKASVAKWNQQVAAAKKKKEGH